MSTVMQLPERDDGKYRTIGFTILLLVFVVFGGWSALAPLGSAAPATGMIVVKSERKTVQHLEGGILDALMVREGDRVVAGQVIARLDVTQVRANLDVLSAQLLGTQARISRLQAERADASEVSWPNNFDNITEDRYLELLDEQQALFIKRRGSLAGEESILRRRIEQLRSRVGGLSDSKKTQAQILISFEKELLNLNELLAQGYVDETRVRDLERRVVELKGRLQQLDSDIKSGEIQIGETELQILQTRAVYDADVQNQLAELQAQRVQLEEQLRVAKDRLVRSEIRAPSDGVVLTVEVTTEGGVVPASQPFITIVPQDDDLVVEARVNPIDVDRVSVGQSAEIQFSAFDSNSIPKIYGDVLSISPDALIDRGTGLSYYLTMLNISPVELKKLDGYTLVPGMPVNVLIQTGERTLWEYLTKPLAQGMSRALIED